MSSVVQSARCPCKCRIVAAPYPSVLARVRCESTERDFDVRVTRALLSPTTTIYAHFQYGKCIILRRRHILESMKYTVLMMILNVSHPFCRATPSDRPTSSNQLLGPSSSVSCSSSSRRSSARSAPRAATQTRSSITIAAKPWSCVSRKNILSRSAKKLDRALTPALKTFPQRLQNVIANLAVV